MSERVTYSTTGTNGDVTSKAERSGLGDLDGKWYRVRWDDGESTWVHSKEVEPESGYHKR